MNRTTRSSLRRHYLPLVLIVAAGAIAVAVVQRKQVDTQPSAQALLLAVADMQHEVTRVPAKLDRLTDEEEIALGNALARHAASLTSTQSDPSHDTAIQAHLQVVGSRVTAHARRKLPWTFHYIPSPAFVNAFALPGGHVFVGEGLLRLMQSEDALAAVLGHEVEHIDLRHCAERAQMEAQVRKSGVIGGLISLPAELFMAGYSKEQELEADRDGTTLAVQSGYSYTGIVQLFDAFERLEVDANPRPAKSNDPVGEAAQLSLATLTGYFASHSASNERVRLVEKLAHERSWPAQPLRCLFEDRKPGQI